MESPELQPSNTTWFRSKLNVPLRLQTPHRARPLLLQVAAHHNLHPEKCRRKQRDRDGRRRPLSTAIPTHYTMIDSDAKRCAIERMSDILNLTHEGQRQMSEAVHDTVQVQRYPEAKPNSKSQSNPQSDSQKTKLALPNLLSCITPFMTGQKGTL
jgi:hypothetical protein